MASAVDSRKVGILEGACKHDILCEYLEATGRLWWKKGGELFQTYIHILLAIFIFISSSKYENLCYPPIWWWQFLVFDPGLVFLLCIFITHKIFPVNINLKLSSKVVSMLKVFKEDPLLGSFNGPGPGGPEATIRKWKREKGWHSLVYAENQQSPWHRTCVSHEGTGRPLEEGWRHRAPSQESLRSPGRRVSKDGSLRSKESAGEREKERHGDPISDGAKVL